MASKSRGYGQSHDWDPMRDDFDNSNYDPQYPDDEASGQVHLDHCRLYITNIPKGLNEEGLRAAFAKHGTLLEMHVSKDPLKRYGLVSYETAGEARQAMMKLNRMEPLKLNINIAHKKKPDNYNKRDGDRQRNGPKDRKERDEVMNSGRERYSNRDRHHRDQDDCVSVGSRTKHTRKEEMANGDNNISIEDLPVELEDEHLALESLNPELQLELERLELEQLKVQQQQLQCKQRILLNQVSRRALAQPTLTNRCVFPGGKVVVRNISEGNTEVREESGFATGAGDSRVGSRACVSCGEHADSFCARCGVTPYCSQRCQQRDWAGRHRAVCHNLARLAGVPVDAATLPVDPSIPPAAPLRRPRSPAAAPQKEPNHPRNGDGSPRKFQPAGYNKKPENAGPRNNNNRVDRRPPFIKGDRNQENDDGSREGRRPQLRHENRNNDEEDWGTKGLDRTYNGSRGHSHRGQGYSRPFSQPQPIDEDWDNLKLTPPKPEVNAEPKEVKPIPKAAQSPRVFEPQKVVPSAVKQVDSPVRQESVKAKESAKPLCTVADVTPVKKMVPKNYIIDTLSIGDTVLLQVDAVAAECRIKTGFVCLTVHESLEDDYNSLCDQYAAACEADTAALTPTPGQAFSYLNPEDGAWYRARCLTPCLAALLDASKLVPIAGPCKRLPAEYEAVPEFCSVLLSNSVKIGDNLKCTLQSKTALGYKVSLEDVEGGSARGDGELTRWLPDVEYPKTAAPLIPEVSRPPLANNSKVFLVDMTAMSRAFVRPADAPAQAQFDDVLQRVVLYGQTAVPLSEPPQMGQLVVAKFEDGLHYRALLKRTNVKQNKYLLEYVEFGNTQVTTLDNLYACPADLQLGACPALTSHVTLGDSDGALAPPAIEYLEKLKDDTVELLLTVQSGENTAVSGSAVTLTVTKNNENVNKKLQAMCTPEWKLIEQRGGDVIETQCLMYESLTYLPLPAQGCELDILDISAIRAGTLSGCPRPSKHADYVFNELTEKMAEYCNSEIGREPYLPKAEELCIAQCPPYPQWFRAVLVEQVSGAGGPEAEVCFIDYGNIERVPVAALRKMLPEFVRALPAVANTLEIRDFPKNATPEVLAKALQFMQVTDEGRGVLTVTRCEPDVPGMYIVDAPALIAAITAP